MCMYIDTILLYMRVCVYVRRLTPNCTPSRLLTWRAVQATRLSCMYICIFMYVYVHRYNTTRHACVYIRAGVDS